jgi:phosphoribosylaminoimidazole carboxylase (NCAIR synthetase)
MNERILLLIPTTSYRTHAFVAAASRLGVSVTVCSEQPSALQAKNPEGFITADFLNPESLTKAVFEFSKKYPIDAVMGVDDQTVIPAAQIAEALSLKHNPVSAVYAARNKYEMRKRLEGHIAQPRFGLFTFYDDAEKIASSLGFSCVIKPLSLSQSRGVMRADDLEELKGKIARLKKILSDSLPSVGECFESYLVEEFIPGKEIAVEGLLINGELRILAIFDKPDSLDGPYFEETIYLTPTELPLSIQEQSSEITSKIVSLLDLLEGPIHAEFRLNEKGIYLIEIAARSIGGFCSSVLRFVKNKEEDPISLEELILRQKLGRQKLGMETEGYEREKDAAGVLMIPISKRGILRGVHGKETARAVPGIIDVIISLKEGEELIPLPEGGRYLGFIFARSKRRSGAVEFALRKAHSKLEILTR